MAAQRAGRRSILTLPYHLLETCVREERHAVATRSPRRRPCVAVPVGPTSTRGGQDLPSHEIAGRAMLGRWSLVRSSPNSVIYNS
jgi:hypothetical protein